MEQARYQEAIAAQERAFALDSSNVWAASSLGLDYERVGEFDKSIEYFDKGDSGKPARSDSQHGTAARRRTLSR
ncbi:MAG: hypothetical protein JO288_00650 [Hyphomicrobiales bacterium]|nr:hypothetical protein [Hyphomicrobiales bacterium]